MSTTPLRVYFVIMYGVAPGMQAWALLEAPSAAIVGTAMKRANKPPGEAEDPEKLGVRDARVGREALWNTLDAIMRDNSKSSPSAVEYCAAMRQSVVLIQFDKELYSALEY